VVRPISVEQTRALRHAVLRPHESLEAVAAHEAPGSFAAGAFDAGELIAVGLVAPDGEPGGWRVRGMATTPHARGRVGQECVEHGASGATRARPPARSTSVQASTSSQRSSRCPRSDPTW